MRYRRLLAAFLLLASLGISGEAAVSVRHAPFWACSDGKGSVSLFWLPPDGRWPVGGFRLERISGGKAVVVASGLGPGADAEAMARLDPSDSEKIRLLAERIRTGALTDDERNRSITVTGRMAVVDRDFGLALGVRYSDRTRVNGKVKYRLKSLSADGKSEALLESNEIDPGKRTSLPRPPRALKAEARIGGVALSWEDPSADGTAPVVAYHVAREGIDRKVRSLTHTPLVLKRHLNRGEPDYLDADAPRQSLTYRVQSVDIFGRRSALAQARVLGKDFPAPDQAAPRIAAAPASREEPPAAAPASAVRPAKPAPAALPAVPAPDQAASRIAAAAGARTDSETAPVFWRPLARMETILHPPPAEAPGQAGAASRPVTAARAEPPNSSATAAASSTGTAPVESAPERPSSDPAASASGRTAAPQPSADAGERSVSGAASENAPVFWRPLARMETIVHPSTAEAPERPAPAAAVPAVRPDEPAAPAAASDSAYSSGRPLARMETIIHPPSGENPEGSTRVADTPSAPAGTGRLPAPAENGTEAAGNDPPTPVIVGIQGSTGTVIIEFRTGGTGKESSRILVIRSDYPTSPGHVVGRPSPQETRTWEDTSVSPGQNLWYRLVAVDKDGNRSLPTNPRWVRVGPR